MNRNPKGCSNIGGPIAANMEYCRGTAMHLFSLYGYHPFSPAELQLVEDVWNCLSPERARRLIPLMSPLGEPCVMRGDLTLSAVAYLASHYAEDRRPLRLSYAERVFSVPTPPRDNLEENQVGVELIGWEGAGADAETAALLLRTLDALSVENSVLVLGDVSVLASLTEGLPAAAARGLTEALRCGSNTNYYERLSALELPANKRTLFERLPCLKGGVGVITEAMSLLEEPSVLLPLKTLCDTLARLGWSQRLRVDLAFVRDLGYYSGPIYNACSCSDGALLGGGGRYDGLLAQEGIEGQAAGFALNLKELASHCSPPRAAPQLTLWGGGCDCAEVLRYADGLSKKGRAFELSWTEDRGASLASAAQRGAGWWVDLGARRVTGLPSGNENTLSEFEAEVLSC